MHKKIIITVLLLFSALYGYSQVSWNVKAGMNLSTQTLYGVDCLKPGYQFGVGMDYFFTEHWGIQPSVMLISKGYKFNHHVLYQELPQIVSHDITANRVYVEMPVMLAYRFNMSDNLKLVLNGGGYISYGIGGKRHSKAFYEDGSIDEITVNTFGFDPPGTIMPRATPRFDTGLGAGVTLEFKNKYTFGLISEWGLKEIDGNAKNQTYGLNIGYKF